MLRGALLILMFGSAVLVGGVPTASAGYADCVKDVVDIVKSLLPAEQPTSMNCTLQEPDPFCYLCMVECPEDLLADRVPKIP